MSANSINTSRRAFLSGSFNKIPHRNQGGAGKIAQINDNCLSLLGISCFTCQDECENRAIRFKPGTNGVARPEINLKQCTGCSDCCTICPVQAITLSPANHQRTRS